MEVAEGTMAFQFEKPSGWTFKAGQYLDMTLLDPQESDAEGNVRSFSIASAPHEETLMVATRMRGTAFKRVLKTTPIETPVRIEGPSRDLILQNDSTRAAVFLAGGIGITPFRSIVYWAAKEKLPPACFSLLFQQAAGRFSIPREPSEPGKRQSKVQVNRQHDGNGEIASTLER
jgi:ferredoxin-NADP reductase